MITTKRRRVSQCHELSPPSGDHLLAYADRAYHAIKQRVEDGTYGPGYRLVLDQLARELSVSPVPVREAVRRLEAEGYLVFTRNHGARVASIDPDRFAHTMQVLAILEGAATALAAPELTAAELDRARRLNQRMRASIRMFDPTAFTRLNREFHGLLRGACPNPHLRGLVERAARDHELGSLTTFRAAQTPMHGSE